MISSGVEADAPQAMRHTLLISLVLAVCVQVHCRVPIAHCRHKVRSPSKCHDHGTCTLYARLTPASNSTLFYCCKDGYKSVKNECVDIDECAAAPKPCEDICTNHPGTYSCSCREGFHHVEATGKCMRTTECSQLNCTHSCFYEASKPVCDCPRGYTLRGIKNCTADERICPTGYHMEYDSHTCRVMGDDPQMLFEFAGQVYEYPLRQRSELRRLVKVEGIVNSIYYDSKAHTAYFAGELLTAYNFSTAEPVSFKQNLPSLAISMAVDYLNGHIYVLDETSLSLWSLKGGGFTPMGELIEHDGKMSQVAVDPGNAWLFYTSSGYVVKARLNGQKFSEVFNFYDHVKGEDVKTEVLAVDDMDHNELFLFYGVNRHIFTFGVDGKRSLWVTDSLPGNVIFMDVFEDFIYYTMEGVDGITARTKDGMKAPVVYFSGQYVRAIYVNHHERQLESVFWTCNKNCAQLCFRDISDFSTCACTTDYVLKQDKTSCVHVNGSVQVSPLGTPSSQIDAREESVSITTTSSLHNGFLVVGCVLLVSICVVQFLLMWWFYPRRRCQQGLGISFAARFHDSSSRVALDSVRDLAED